jgi:hypothetical protein
MLLPGTSARAAVCPPTGSRRGGDDKVIGAASRSPSSSISELSHNLSCIFSRTHTHTIKEEETSFAVTSLLTPKIATFSSIFHH